MIYCFNWPNKSGERFDGTKTYLLRGICEKGSNMTDPRPRSVWQHDTEDISEDQIREYFHRLRWKVDRFGKDYGEDLFIRIFERGAFAGKIFYVQLKGTNSLQKYALKMGDFSYEVDSVNLLQWYRNPFPVIFVLWDNEQRIGYWLHIQPYVEMPSRMLCNDSPSQKRDRR